MTVFQKSIGAHRRLIRPGGRLLTACLLVTGCTVYQPETDPQPIVELQESFSDGGEQPIGRWWLDFDEPQLAEVVETALADNRSLRMAWARLDQMQALARAAGAARYPSVDVVIGADRTRYGGDLPPVTGAPSDDTVDTMLASVGVSYQLDLWKKIANSRRAALLEVEASEGDLQATALAVSAAAGELWWQIAAQRETLELLEQQLEVGQNYLDLVQVRFARGLASAAEVYQQRLQVETTRAQIPIAATRLEVSKHQLAVLLGLEPRAETPLPGSALPQLPAMPATGVPLEVLRDRPDVRAAEMRLVAADHRVAVAVADRYPSISLGLTAGGQASSFADVLDQWFVGIAADLFAPIFDGGRRKAEVDRNRAVVEQLFYGWESTVLIACREVEDALVLEQGLAESNRILGAQLEYAQASLERSRALYVNGLIDYLNVLTSLQALQELERQAVTTHRDLLVNRVRLYLALGGSWTAQIERPDDITGEQT